MSLGPWPSRGCPFFSTRLSTFPRFVWAAAGLCCCSAGRRGPPSGSVPSYCRSFMPEQVPMTIGRSKIGARFRESEADTHTKSERLDPGRKGSCTAGSEVWIRTNRTGAADERRVDCYQRSAQRYHRANDEPTGLCAPCGVLSSPVASPNGARKLVRCSLVIGSRFFQGPGRGNQTASYCCQMGGVIERACVARTTLFLPAGLASLWEALRLSGPYRRAWL